MAKPTGMPTGRPSIYNIAIATEICDTIALSNQSLQSLCFANDHWPSYQAIYEWITSNREGFGDLYAKAKEAQADHLCDSILTIIDKPETVIGEDGIERTDVAMCRLKVDSLKWQAMKLKPKKYGIQHQQVDATITHESTLQDLA